MTAARVEARVELERLTDGAEGTARFSGVFDTTGRGAGSYRLEAGLANGASATDIQVIEPDQSR